MGSRHGRETIAGLGENSASDWLDNGEYISGVAQIDPESFSATWQDQIVWGFLPKRSSGEHQLHDVGTSASLGKDPVYIFMHGSTGEWDMYEQTLKQFSRHGFIVLFPFVKSPRKDKHFWTTDPQGFCISRVIEFLQVVIDSTGEGCSASPAAAMEFLHTRADLGNVVIGGHSMGANGALMATHRWVVSKSTCGDVLNPTVSVKAMIAHHPGICGPWGPPPWPYCWSKQNLGDIMLAGVPVLMLTAANDVAFRGTSTALRQYEGFEGGLEMASTSKVRNAGFVELRAEVCSEDGKRRPMFDDGGHNCPLKLPVHNPETPWALRFAKLFTQLSGATNTRCYQWIFLEDHDVVRKFDLIDSAGERRRSYP